MQGFRLAAIAAILLVSAGVQAEERFFPDGVWGRPDSESHMTQGEQDLWYEHWFGNRLRKEGEKPLWVQRAKDDAVLSIRMSVFRGAVMPDFSMIRVSMMPDGEAKYYARAYDFCPVTGNPKVMDTSCLELVERRGVVDPVMASKIGALIEEISPFTSKTASRGGESGLDGVETVFEFSEDGKFNAMMRWEIGSINGGPLARLAAVMNEI